MEKSILISVRNVYGNDTIYPECETSKNFARIAGTKTLTLEVLGIIKLMGYEVEIKHTHCLLKTAIFSCLLT